jgi:hypothetical protein
MRPRYSLTVLDEIPHARAIARPDWPACSFSLMTSRSFRIGSLSAAIPPPLWRRQERRTTQRRQRSVAIGRSRSPDGTFSDRHAPESVIGFDRNQ